MLVLGTEEEFFLRQFPLPVPTSEWSLWRVCVRKCHASGRGGKDEETNTEETALELGTEG